MHPCLFSQRWTKFERNHANEHVSLEEKQVCDSREREFFVYFLVQHWRRSLSDRQILVDDREPKREIAENVMTIAERTEEFEERVYEKKNEVHLNSIVFLTVRDWWEYV